MYQHLCKMRCRAGPLLSGPSAPSSGTGESYLLMGPLRPLLLGPSLQLEASLGIFTVLGLRREVQ